MGGLKMQGPLYVYITFETNGFGLKIKTFIQIFSNQQTDTRYDGKKKIT